MYEQSRDTPFKKKIRLREEQLEWIRENKGKYTLAGKLDEIINFYKNEFNKTPRFKTRGTKKNKGI